MRKILIPLLVLFLYGGGCCNKNGGKVGGAEAASHGDTLLLPAPAVPDAIVEPEARAAWAAARWWEKMDFTDHRRSLDTAFMEQNFSNFISVAAYADSAARDRSMENLLKRAEADTAAWRFVGYVAEKYLYDPNSPYRSDELYAAYVFFGIGSCM